MKDISLIPIWGNIFSPLFVGCRIPATSASCESEFNRIKTYWISKNLHSIRPDVFVEMMIDYLKGKLLIIASDIEETRRKNENESSCTLECKICTNAIDSKNVYSCYHCQDFVHKDKCTEMVEEKRLCRTCSVDPLAKRHAAMDSNENWGGQGQPRIVATVKISCIACKNGNMPGGAHKCHLCNAAVHIIEGCSLPVEGEEEGYGEKRVCYACHQSNNSLVNTDTSQLCDNSNILENCFEHENIKNIQSSSREMVDNSSLPGVEVQNDQTRQKKVDYLSDERNKSRLPAKYYGKRPDDVRDSIDWDRSTFISAIKNGNDKKLEKQSINGQPTILRNTCSFDSLLYLSLFAVHDFPDIQKKVSKISIFSIFLSLFFMMTMNLDVISKCF